MPAANKGFGDRLVALRTERGVSQSRLADLLDVTSTAVWNWEQQGVRPRPAMLAKLARVLGVSQEYLLTGGGAVTAKRSAVEVIKAAADEIAALNGVPVDRVHIDWRIESERAAGSSS